MQAAGLMTVSSSSSRMSAMYFWNTRHLCYIFIIMVTLSFPCVLLKKKPPNIIVISGDGGTGGGGSDTSSSASSGGINAGAGGGMSSSGRGSPMPLLMDAAVQENDIVIIGGGSGNGAPPMAMMMNAEEDKKMRKMNKLKRMTQMMQMMTMDRKKPKSKGPIIIMMPDKPAADAGGGECGGSCFQAEQEKSQSAYSGAGGSDMFESMSQQMSMGSIPRMMPMMPMYPQMMMMPPMITPMMQQHPIPMPSPPPQSPYMSMSMPEGGPYGSIGGRFGPRDYSGMGSNIIERDGRTDMMMALMTELKMSRMMSKLEKMLDD